jgi:hypothetical protein
MDQNRLRALAEMLRRQPYPSELDYFSANPSVAGMATEDDAIILNPYSPNTGGEQDAVMYNELVRLLARRAPFAPNFSLTPEQAKFLDATSYKNAPPRARQETILGRIFSGDPSGGVPTGDQIAYGNALLGYVGGGLPLNGRRR